MSRPAGRNAGRGRSGLIVHRVAQPSRLLDEFYESPKAVSPRLREDMD